MRRMYSESQLKELISEMSGDILEVKNVKQLNDEQCNNLKVGDIVAKKTGSQYHLYLVTYKQEKHGLCLSYFDASVVETQSYDYTDGHWVYNSEDKTALEGGGGTKLFQHVIYLNAENTTILTITSTSSESLVGTNVKSSAFRDFLQNATICGTLKQGAAVPSRFIGAYSSAGNYGILHVPSSATSISMFTLNDFTITSDTITEL